MGDFGHKDYKGHKVFVFLVFFVPNPTLHALHVLHG